jgi:hypothetical protein
MTQFSQCAQARPPGRPSAAAAVHRVDDKGKHLDVAGLVDDLVPLLLVHLPFQQRVLGVLLALAMPE